MKKIVIICDFHKNSGFGHLTRMKSLAKSLKNLNEVVFLFNISDKKFIYNYVKGFKCNYVEFSLKKYSIKFEKFLIELGVDIIIFDSYFISLDLEKKLYDKYFLVSIDDKILKHNSHVVFNSKEELSSEKLSKSGKIWITGKKCILMNKTQKKINNNFSLKKILIHAGGSDAYKFIDKFLNYSLIYLSTKDITVDILYKDENIKKSFKNKIKNLNIDKKKFIFKKFDKKLSTKLKNYDVVAGPAGTTTYEAISSGVVPFSFPLSNDGRDSIKTWNLLGNITHLNFYEKDKKKIVVQIWDFIFLNYKMLSQIIEKNSRSISDNSLQISNLIIKLFQKRFLLNKKKNNNFRLYKLKKANIKYIRFFLNSRNAYITRKVSSNPSHIISYPEHLNWWQNTDIKKFILFKEDKFPLAYLWIRQLKKENKNIVISGWFLDINEKDTLRTSFKVIDFQKKILKKKFKGLNWLININKNNIFSIRMNKAIGFKKASNISVQKALKIFKFNKSKFNVYEMKL
jgi:spore coat polysaccharide biosynthesis predicted glycosyltransferase SpsG